MSIGLHFCNGIKLVWRDKCQRCSLFSPQKRASFQQVITGHLSETNRLELEPKLSETERKIMRAKQEQEEHQEYIDRLKQALQNKSQEQNEGRACVLAPVMFKGHV